MTTNYAQIIHSTLGELIPLRSKVALFDFPNYSNVGDSAIWLGEIAYLDKFARAQIVYTGTFNQSLPAIDEDVVILIQGGGNFGDLYPHHQNYREQIIQRYARNRVVQLPQSIHFMKSDNMESCRRILSSHPNFHLVVRDKESLELASKLHDGPNHLCPDMALCLGSLPRTRGPVHAVVGLLRTDKEKVVAEACRPADPGHFFATDWLDEPATALKSASGRFQRMRVKYPRWTGWMERFRPPLFNALARERVRRGSNVLCSGEVVITDRLHGHIMCCLLGIPHVVMDNSYRKIGNFRDAWGTGAGLSVTGDTLTEALAKAEVLLERVRSGALDQFRSGAS